ncbi:unnamed protein product [Schistosoma mattheei]|uniref:Uncharacterized protein n=1 Tax=Schistosoma mattheei TaxID=31246 RepID=A0A3P7XP91_9TREM|nr:unnamed protein product [Schistosoma mattheei]
MTTVTHPFSYRYVLLLVVYNGLSIRGAISSLVVSDL